MAVRPRFLRITVAPPCGSPLLCKHEHVRDGVLAVQMRPLKAGLVGVGGGGGKGVVADAAGRATETHQYSVSEYAVAVGTQERPMLAIQYDTSPIVVTIRERPYNFLHFLVRICAVVGGAFAITGACRVLHQVLRHLLEA
jgi:Endoplasmic reticulum vesicle transporter